MNLVLEYGKVYDVKIKGGNYKGIYLGHRAPRLRLKSKHSMLTNKSDSVLWGFSLIGFSKYIFSDDNKLILNRVYYINPSHKEKGNLEELLKKIQ
jgi:hypothetical protein